MTTPETPGKPKARSFARRYKPALTGDASGVRQVVLSSILVKGEVLELISAHDTRLNDDAYIQGIRNEILGAEPFKGQYARRMQLVHIATRRISHDNGDVLYKHTSPKKDKNTRKVIVDEYTQQPTFYPRAYIVRLVSEEEREMEKEEREHHRKKVLSTCAFILQRHDADNNKKRFGGGTPGRRSLKNAFTPTQYKVPDNGWDLTPETPLPLDCYITDHMISSIIECVYVEQEFGRWDMFAENLSEADCFFTPPYSQVAQRYGFRNPDESSVRHAVPPRRVEADEELRPGRVQQAYNIQDVFDLEPSDTDDGPKDGPEE